MYMDSHHDSLCIRPKRLQYSLCMHLLQRKYIFRCNELNNPEGIVRNDGASTVVIRVCVSVCFFFETTDRIRLNDNGFKSILGVSRVLSIVSDVRENVFENN